jgi:hypothetical protein
VPSDVRLLWCYVGRDDGQVEQRGKPRDLLMLPPIIERATTFSVCIGLLWIYYRPKPELTTLVICKREEVPAGLMLTYLLALASPAQRRSAGRPDQR